MERSVFLGDKQVQLENKQDKQEELKGQGKKEGAMQMER